MNIIETEWQWKSGLSKRNKTDMIVLHHAAAKSCTAADVDRWHKSNGWSGIGYHFFVSKDGFIYRGRPIWAVGAHCSGENSHTIGICAEGDYSKEQTMPRAQYLAIKDLIEYIKSHYGNLEVKGHRDIGSSDCPGEYYPLEDMKKAAEESEDLEMEELKREFAELKDKVGKLETAAGGTMVYNYVDSNMPDWAHEAVEFFRTNNILNGDSYGRLNLNNKDLRLLVMLYRAIRLVCKLINVKV